MAAATLLSVFLWVAWFFSARWTPAGGRSKAAFLVFRGGMFGLALALALAVLMTLTAGPRNPYFFKAVIIGLALLGIPFGCLGSLAGSLRRP